MKAYYKTQTKRGWKKTLTDVIELIKAYTPSTTYNANSVFKTDNNTTIQSHNNYDKRLSIKNNRVYILNLLKQGNEKECTSMII
jgi:hypothetical protein